jgi:regulator of replication initiation timing
MKKQTKKEIEGTLRNKLQKKFNDDLASYKERLEKLANENYELQKKLREKVDENIALRDKVDQYEDWNRRLQEFCDMNEEDRKAAIEQYKTDQILAEHLNRFSTYLNIFGI